MKVLPSYQGFCYHCRAVNVHDRPVVAHVMGPSGEERSSAEM